MATLSSKSFVVTGGSGNLGQSTVRALVSRGARVLVVDRDDTRPKVTFAEEVAARRVFTARVDLTNPEAVSRDLAKHLEPLDDLFGLVATVGGYKGGASVLDGTWEDWESMWRINVATSLLASRAVLPKLVARKAGALVHVASLAALGGNKNQVAYGSAKAAVLRLSEGLADELKEHGIRVNAVLPGTMDTRANRSWMSAEVANTAVDTAAVADVIAFLLSDEARGVTGSAIRVAGFQ